MPPAPDQTRPQTSLPAADSAASTGRVSSQGQGTSSNGSLSPSREIFGFATAGSLADPSIGYPSWNFNLLSTVAFFAIHVQYNGVMIADSNWDVWSSSTLTGLVSTAHAHGVKVVITVVGPNNPIDQCDSLYNADTTVLQVVNQVTSKGVDGVNIDYEGQLAQCQNNNPALNTTNQALMTNFAKLMRAGLDNARPGSYLSIDTYSASASGPDGFFNIPDLNRYVDSFFVMAYDMDWANQPYPPLSCSACLAPVSPLTNYFYNDTISMSQYSAVVGPGKTILGQPYYGRVACVASPVAHATPVGGRFAATYVGAAAVASSPDVRPGTYAVHRDANDATGLDRWDTWYDNSLGCWREMYWADTVTLGNRYDFVNQNNLRGVGFWTLNYGGGAPELWDTLQSHFVACASAGVTGNPGSPQLSGTQVQLVATSTNCNHPLYEFWMQPPGGTWTLVQPYTTSPNFYWNTLGKPVGTYRFSVWARAASTAGVYGSAPNTYDAFSTLNYSLTTQPCTGLTASAAPSTTTVGTTVTITGAATGCPNPLYRFWLLPPGGSWTQVQAYAANPIFTWNTAGRPAGSYLFSVWTRDTSSPGKSGAGLNTYDAAGPLQYALTWPACSAASASAAPPTTATVGMTVAITGSATGCPTPLYQFWLLPPGGSWFLVQPYSTSATFTWMTAGKPVGSYRFSVWARDANGPGTSAYDAFDAFQYPLTTAPCTAMTASSAPPSTTSVGTTVTIIASATGCPNPLFEVWLFPPGGGWTLAQPYAAGNTITWNTAGKPAGSYRFSVWARDVSSSAAYDGFSAFPYSLTLAPCTASNASAAPPSTATMGTTVTVTGSATGCPNPQYEFWVLPPGGTWTLVQPYSNSAVLTWTTSGKPTGSYRFSVWARDASSPGTSPYTYDSFSAFQYSLT